MSSGERCHRTIQERPAPSNAMTAHFRTAKRGGSAAPVTSREANAPRNGWCPTTAIEGGGIILRRESRDLDRRGSLAQFGRDQTGRLPRADEGAVPDFIGGERAGLAQEDSERAGIGPAGAGEAARLVGRGVLRRRVADEEEVHGARRSTAQPSATRR